MSQRDIFKALREKLARNRCAAGAGGRATIVAFGDSVTLGLAGKNELLHEETYHARLRAGFSGMFPATPFNMINAGVSGDTARAALGRLEHDALDCRPDLVMVAFGLNDSGAGEKGLCTFRENLAAIVSNCLEAGAGVVLLTPNMMATRNNVSRVSREDRRLLAPFIERQESGLLARYAAEIRAVGGSAGVPVADVYAEWERRRALGEDMDARLANGLNHPDAAGHRIACKVLLGTLVPLLDEEPVPG